MNRTKAVATLVIGDHYQRNFNQWFRPDWQHYCAKHDLDLVVIAEPLDFSERASQRSPAWQKCILHRSEKISQYSQIAWVDADVKISRNAPNIFSGVSPERIGAVDEYSVPTAEDHRMVLERLYRYWDLAGVQYIRNLTPQEYHRNFGIDADWNYVVNTGVIVFSPQHHSAIFERAYQNYEEKGHASWNYEMRPLSHEILSAGCVTWLSPKFNMTWSLCQQSFYQFLDGSSTVTRLLCWLRRAIGNPRMGVRQLCVQAAAQNNYFLHFAGGSTDYRLLSD